jgi:hypothetical protein
MIPAHLGGLENKLICLKYPLLGDMGLPDVSGGADRGCDHEPVSAKSAR